MEQQFNKTRIAPTPSGYLHLGNALSFKLTSELSEKTGAKILLRIDDLDRERVNKDYVQDVFDTLNFLEIQWDEGPRNFAEYEKDWSQIHRLGLYSQALQQLADSNAVFACTCSRTQIANCTCRNKSLPLDTPNATWRLKTDLNKQLLIVTLNDGTVKNTLPKAMKDFIVRKKDGYPAYQLTSLIDDIHYGINLVVRGEDLWDSTVAQHYLALVLNKTEFQKITFHHHELIMESRGVKLSKSAGATSIKYLREQGKSATNIYEEIEKMFDSKSI